MEQLLSDTASLKLVNGVLKLAEELAEQKIKQTNKRYLNQTEVCTLYNCTYRDIERWLRLGLTRRKQGTKWIYDVKDIERIFELEKQ